MKKPTAILIDDEPDIRELLAISLSRQGLDCLEAASFSEGLNLIKSTECDLCITDIRMPDGSGLDLVKHFKMLHPNTPIAVMTAFDTTDIAVQAMKAGAFDFLAKPIRAKRLESLISDALNVSTSESLGTAELSENEQLPGISPAAQKLRILVEKAAKSMAPVVIQGEVGSGKEQLAKLIHSKSLRRNGPFISIDCSALPKEKIEEALFGIAISEVDDASRGVLLNAQSGSLFLDEVGTLPDHVQSKLLTTLKERRIVSTDRVSEHLDTRIFVGSTFSLESEVQTGKLRSDLYYMLNVIEAQISPLRDRPEDIAPICEMILVLHSENKPAKLCTSALDKLQEYDFPGNTNELENILLRAEVVCEDGLITAEELQFPPNFQQKMESQARGLDPLNVSDLEAYISQVEREIISAVLSEERWNQTKAAKRLNLTPRQFRYKLAKYRLNNNG